MTYSKHYVYKFARRLLLMIRHLENIVFISDQTHMHSTQYTHCTHTHTVYFNMTIFFLSVSHARPPALSRTYLTGPCRQPLRSLTVSQPLWCTCRACRCHFWRHRARPGQPWQDRGPAICLQTLGRWAFGASNTDFESSQSSESLSNPLSLKKKKPKKLDETRLQLFNTIKLFYVF